VGVPEVIRVGHWYMGALKAGLVDERGFALWFRLVLGFTSHFVLICVRAPGVHWGGVGPDWFVCCVIGLRVVIYLEVYSFECWDCEGLGCSVKCAEFRGVVKEVEGVHCFGGGMSGDNGGNVANFEYYAFVQSGVAEACSM
jgi:hypothetical protein